MSKQKKLLGLDVGTVRIGAALGDTAIRIAIPYGAIEVDGREFEAIARLVVDNDIDTIVIGYPRNQSGGATEQTAYVEAFADKLKDIASHIAFQDESLTSVIAEKRLAARKVPVAKGEVDAEAAAIILQDYMEQTA